ncbi:hypothetical protein L3Q82_013605 [Scortum barcoo]|uniref:Uncharacterized protein n=1 Tax=Scortum barcoo TaxID=214431 RepID=A0ACB8W141_9TELE|nr:hypothetical protein L3Q82_013605 [Scortum barcoo]
MFSVSIVDAAVRSCGPKVSGACCGGNNPRTRKVGALELTGTGRPSKPQPLGGPGGKNSGLGGVRVRGPGGGPIDRPRRNSGKPSGASEGGSSALPTLFTVRVVELLTSTGDIVGQWKEYFEDLLNPTARLPLRKQRLGTLRWTRPSPKPEVTEVVRKLLGGKAPGVDENPPRVPQVLWMLWGCLGPTTCLCSIAWRS